MPVKVYRRKGSLIYNYRGTVADRRLRGSTGTTDKKRAERIAAEIENNEWKCRLDGPEAVLTFAKASILYRASKELDRKQMRYLEKIEDYWKDTLVKDMKRGAIRQSAIEMYPGCSGATWNRQVITPTQAVINHCASLDLCAPMIKIERFDYEEAIKRPTTLDWLDNFCAHAEPAIAALAIFMFATGCRISDARRIEWSDIDFNERTILISRTKDKKQRLPHLPQRLLIALANLPRDRSPFGRPESTLRRAWDATVVAAGIRRLTFHSCRHGATTALLHEGIDVVTVGKLVGMAPERVLRTYGHAQNDPKLTEGLFGAANEAKIRSGK
jgi:integrase